MRYPEVIKVIPGFHHEICRFGQDYIVLSKDGGIKVFDGAKWELKWEERLNGEMLFAAVVHQNILHASGIKMKHCSIDLLQRKVIEKSNQKISIQPSSVRGNRAWALMLNGDNTRRTGVLDLDNFTFDLEVESVGAQYMGFERDFVVYLSEPHGQIGFRKMNNEIAWSVNILELLNETSTNGTWFIGSYDTELFFAIDSRENNYIVAVNENDGAITRCLSNIQTGLPTIATYNSFLYNRVIYTIAHGCFFELDLVDWTYRRYDEKHFVYPKFNFTGERLFFSMKNRVGEYDLEKKKIKWLKSYYLGITEIGEASFIGLQYSNGFLLASDSAENLNILDVKPF